MELGSGKMVQSALESEQFTTVVTKIRCTFQSSLKWVTNTETWACYSTCYCTADTQTRTCRAADLEHVMCTLLPKWRSEWGRL